MCRMNTFEVYIVNDKTLVIIISQSGETADTLAAVREAKKREKTRNDV